VVRLGLVQSAHYGALASMARVSGVAEVIARFLGLVDDMRDVHSSMASRHRESRAGRLSFDIKRKDQKEEGHLDLPQILAFVRSTVHQFVCVCRLSLVIGDDRRSCQRSPYFSRGQF
jgi:hypothetical protein